ncbi:alpha/beta fold hydrolase [Rhodanobacter sp. 7MK24]|uniref:alpha/beta hydrolase family protein n=1 Tax=Rhodanobacter sp. 7MK24 TaxID=2775922 RepID=UPI00177BF8BB|nr:alpha/beta fold hydrolase [Rhodanobacter sp. 7MK24]MBD8879296.1 alpha/beta fold hydrolase [Rhodanobacter sp. 7MK24]
MSPTTATEPTVLPLTMADGARAELLCVAPDGEPRDAVFWLPAMGMPAKHYLPLAAALAARGVAVALHEWRGIGSSSLRASHRCNWSYRELLQLDLPAGMAALRAHWPQARAWVGGHSLGGQLACLYAALHPGDMAGIALVASGAPYWRRFRHGTLVGMAYVLAPLLAALRGHLPGRRIGFGGNEARGVIADWARSGRTGRYAAAGMAEDFEQRLAALELPVLAQRMRDDWLGPAASLDWLLGKMPHALRRHKQVTPDDLGGAPADHFSWMKAPGSIAARMVEWIATDDAVFTTPHHSSP